MAKRVIYIREVFFVCEITVTVVCCVLQCLQIDYKMQGSLEKSGKQHCGAKKFILALRYRLIWHLVVDGTYQALCNCY